MKSQKKRLDKQFLYQANSAALLLKADVKGETIWATQDQVAELFDVKKAAISKHVKNIFSSGELEKKATVSKMETVRKEGIRHVNRKLDYYNLDLILSIGYRVNSTEATRFRQWATKTLKDHITKGLTINRKRIKNNYEQFQKAVDDVKKLLPDGRALENESVLELITLFADTCFSLDAYDKDQLASQGVTKRKAKLTAEKLSSALGHLKEKLINKGRPLNFLPKNGKRIV